VLKKTYCHLVGNEYFFDMLEESKGCAVVISHDRWFLDRIATHILAYEDEGHIEWFEGNFEVVRKITIETLQDNGYQTHEACDGIDGRFQVLSATRVKCL